MIEFERGPTKALADHLMDAPGYTTEQRKFFWYDWGPIFYRGRLNGSARLLGIASDPGPTERIAARTLDGDARSKLRRRPAKQFLHALETHTRPSGFATASSNNLR